MSGFFAKLLGGDLVEGIGKIVDNVHTSDEEQMEMELELFKAQTNYDLEMAKIEVKKEEEITKRWDSDNQHELTRLVRPALVAYSVILFSAVLFTDGNIGDFTIKTSYIPLIETLLMTTVGGYFILRTYDKHSHNKHKKRRDENNI